METCTESTNIDYLETRLVYLYNEFFSKKNGFKKYYSSK